MPPAPQPRQLQGDALGRILAVARHLGASSDLREILSRIIDAMRDTLEADRATVFEFDSKTSELFTHVAHGMARASASQPLREIRIPISAGLAGECARTRQIINTPDAYADARFNQAVDRQTGYRTHSILTVPLLAHDGELVGVAQVLNKRGGAFTAEDEEIATALAAQAAVAMKRGRLLEDRLMRQKLERDLELARKIQQSSFPAALPVMNAFDIAAWNEPADRTGGDVYDVVACDASGAVLDVFSDHAAVRRTILLMADATGHGVGPALSVTQLRSMLRMAVRLGADLSAIAQHANRQLAADLPGGRFITAWLGRLDDADGTLTSFSAGQAPLLRYRAAEDAFEVMESNTVPLGVLETLQAQPAAPMPMNAGDLFAVISDGIFEARNPAGDDLGDQRVMNVLRAARSRSAQEIIQAVREMVVTFVQGRPADDDRTAIIIKRRG